MVANAGAEIPALQATTNSHNAKSAKNAKNGLSSQAKSQVLELLIRTPSEIIVHANGRILPGTSYASIWLSVLFFSRGSHIVYLCRSITQTSLCPIDRPFSSTS